MRRSKDSQNSQSQTFDSDSGSGPATSDQASDMQWVNNSRSRYRGSGGKSNSSTMPWNYFVMRLLRMKLLKVLLILSILAVALYFSIGIWTEFSKDKGSLKSERVKMQLHDEEDRVLDGMNRGPQAQHKNNFDNVNINQRVGLPGFGDDSLEQPQEVQQHHAQQRAQQQHERQQQVEVDEHQAQQFAQHHAQQHFVQHQQPVQQQLQQQQIDELNVQQQQDAENAKQFAQQHLMQQQEHAQQQHTPPHQQVQDLHQQMQQQFQQHVEQHQQQAQQQSQPQPPLQQIIWKTWYS